MFSGLYPIRMAVTEDDGATWSELKPIGDFGGVVTMATVLDLKTPGHYLAFFHDDGRFIRRRRGGKVSVKSPHSDHTSPHGEALALLGLHDALATTAGSPGASRARSPCCPMPASASPARCVRPMASRSPCCCAKTPGRYNSFVIFSNDEGLTWSEPRELPAALTGDRHIAKYAPDGRLFISFRDTTHVSPTKGDWVGWVGTYDDIVKGREGQYRVRIMDNTKGADCTYPGVELLPDGTFVTTTYGHWTEGEPPYIVSVRFKLEELDAKVKR